MTENPETKVESIAILGGTGDLGGGLARQWSRAGYRILIGSRTLEKGQAAATVLLDEFPDLNVTGHENLDAATQADLVVLTVPFEHQISTLETVKLGLLGKILVDVTVPLVPPKVGTVQLPESGSAAPNSASPPQTDWCRSAVVRRKKQCGRCWHGMIRFCFV